MSFSNYISGIFTGVKSLLGGMSVTMKEFWTPKVTEEYPENRDTLVISDRWRSELTMSHDGNNEHACTACGICQNNCPNGTIEVVSKMVVTEDGKKKKILDHYVYNLGTCVFCNLCVLSCPSDAIQFSNDFESAVFTKDKLVMQLNREGSKLREKKKADVPKPAAPVADAKPAKPAEAKVVEPKTEIKAEAPAPATPVAEAKSAKPADEAKVDEAPKVAEAKSIETKAEPTTEKTKESETPKTETTNGDKNEIV